MIREEVSSGLTEWMRQHWCAVAASILMLFPYHPGEGLVEWEFLLVVAVEIDLPLQISKEGIIWINLGTFIEIYSMGFHFFLIFGPVPHSKSAGCQLQPFPDTWVTGVALSIRRFSTGLLLGCASHICKWFIIHIYWGYSIHSMCIYIYICRYMYKYIYIYTYIYIYIYV